MKGIVNDMWRFDPITHGWILITPPSGEIPSPRHGPAAWAVDNYLWMWGGILDTTSKLFIIIHISDL